MTMKSDMKITKGLTASKRFEVRFSEVDSMNIVWHGSYPLYFEDAREAFGARYGLGYMDIFGNGYYAPLVELSFKYKSPIVYGMPCRIDIHYRPTEAAKIVFDYEIHHAETDELLARATACRSSWTRSTGWCGSRRNFTHNGKSAGT